MPADNTSPNFAPTLSSANAGSDFAMPTVGYGTMLFPEPERAVGLVVHALESGYHHIDMARKYGSEQWVGEGIRASGIAREELFVTTKVTEEDAHAADFARSADTSLEALGLDYVDLLLIHWPQPRVPLAETLGALAKAKRDGLLVTCHVPLARDQPGHDQDDRAPQERRRSLELSKNAYENRTGQTRVKYYLSSGICVE